MVRILIGRNHVATNKNYSITYESQKIIRDLRMKEILGGYFLVAVKKSVTLPVVTTILAFISNFALSYQIQGCFESELVSPTLFHLRGLLF